MPRAMQAPHDIAAHTAQADDTEFHGSLPALVLRL
jgi:hypothetical protein